MDYVFGIIQREEDESYFENLKVISEEGTNLNGYVEVHRDYADSEILDAFKVVNKYDSQVGIDGMVYDWYEITEHYRNIDKSIKALQENEKLKADIDYICLVSDITLDEEENTNGTL